MLSHDPVLDGAKPLSEQDLGHMANNVGLIGHRLRALAALIFDHEQDTASRRRQERLSLYAEIISRFGDELVATADEIERRDYDQRTRRAAA